MTTSRRSRQTSFVDGSASTLWPTPDATMRPHEGNVRLLRAKVEAGEITEAEAYAILGKSLREPQGKLTDWTPALFATPQHHDHHPGNPERVRRFGSKHGGRNLNDEAAAGILPGCSPPATPASRSATPGSVPERMTPGTSGRGFSDCLPNSAPTVLHGFVSKMSEGTSAWGSTVCSLTWTTSATPQRRGLFLLRASARFTGGTGCGLSDAGRMPMGTPTAGVGEKDAAPTQGMAHRYLVRGKGGNLLETVAATMWPTPRAGKTTDESEDAWTAGQSTGAVSTPPLSLAVKMWPTPTVQDGKNDAGPSQWERNSDPLNGDVQRVGLLFQSPMPSDVTGGRTTKGSKRQDETGLRQQAMAVEADRSAGYRPTGQRLNPDFVSRLMGFPDGWLDLDPA